MNSSAYHALDERRTYPCPQFEEQGKLTNELRESIHAAVTLTALEDLYAPLQKETPHAGYGRTRKRVQPLARIDHRTAYEWFA